MKEENDLKIELRWSMINGECLGAVVYESVRWGKALYNSTWHAVIFCGREREGVAGGDSLRLAEGTRGQL